MGGFEVGKGIGKNNQGIINPVEAVMKSDNKCLGNGQFVNKEIVKKVENPKEKQLKTEE